MGKPRIIVCQFVLMFGLAPLINSMSNPRLAALRGPDYLQIVAFGLCFGFGLGVLFGGRKFLGE